MKTAQWPSVFRASSRGQRAGVPMWELREAPVVEDVWEAGPASAEGSPGDSSETKAPLSAVQSGPASQTLPVTSPSSPGPNLRADAPTGHGRLYFMHPLPCGCTSHTLHGGNIAGGGWKPRAVAGGEDPGREPASAAPLWGLRAAAPEDKGGPEGAWGVGHRGAAPVISNSSLCF